MSINIKSMPLQANSLVVVEMTQIRLEVDTASSSGNHAPDLRNGEDYESRISTNLGEHSYCSGYGIIGTQMTGLGKIFFFLKYVGELCIFVLSRRKTVPYKQHHLTPDQAVRS
jgi:hypothetical protein